METEICVPCIVWNTEEEVWVLPSANDLEPGTLPTISEVVKKIGVPIKVRYPGGTHTIDDIQ
jgi:hypothetical protein